MKLLFKSIAVAFLLAIFLHVSTTKILAVVEITSNPTTINENTPKTTLEFKNLVVGTKYYFTTLQDGSGNKVTLKDATKATSTSISFDVCGAKDDFLKTGCSDSDWFNGNKTYTAIISVEDSGTLKELARISFTVTPFSPTITVTPTNPKNTDPLTITIKGSRRPANVEKRNKYIFDLSGKAPDGTNINTSNPHEMTVPVSGEISENFGPLQNGDYTLKAKYSGDVIATFSIKVTDTGGSVGGGSSGGSGAGTPGHNPCGPDGKECPTALGNIPTTPTAFAGKVLTVGIGLAGGIALIIMVVGSIKILTSSGDPKKVGEGREMIVAAVAGLLFLILSILILRFIGATFLPANPF